VISLAFKVFCNPLSSVHQLHMIIIIASFGIGTSLTNDFYTLSSGQTIKSKALNIVIKITAVDKMPCIKISDDPSKV
jgi:nicotinic acid phosphoribosyltransferase